MRRLKDIKGERALDIMADILDPVTEIFADEQVAKMYRAGVNRIKLVQYVIKEYKKQVITILALLEDEDPKTYEVNLLTLPIKVAEVINDPDLNLLFTLQGQEAQTLSGSATENTEETDKK